MSISLVAALGNPGRDYADTRHNLGWVVIDAFARREGLAWQKHSRFDAEVARWDYAPGRTRWLVKIALKRARLEVEKAHPKARVAADGTVTPEVLPGGRDT